MMQEIFLPRIRIPIYEEEQIDELVDMYSGKKDIYKSVYKYNGYGKSAIKPENAIVDKIFLDFDYDDDLKFFDDAKKVAKLLYDSKVKFYIRFSGRGFHIYISLDKDVKLTNPRKAIRNYVNELHSKTGTTSDPAVVGDLRRVSRIVGSMNMKTHLHCIPLSYAQLMNFTYKAICETAVEFNYNKKYWGDDYREGSEELDISYWDSNEVIEDEYTHHIDVSNIQVSTSLPPCIEKMLNNPQLGYYERGQLIIYLRDDGYGFSEILTILKTILSPQKYYHCTEEENQPEYLYYVREDIIFSSCATLKNNGLCCSDLCSGHNLYI